jgi:hypothetical protein
MIPCGRALRRRLRRYTRHASVAVTLRATAGFTQIHAEMTMSKNSNREHDGGDDRGPKGYKLTVDGRHYETSQSRLTGLQIKSLAGVDASFGLYLEGRGQDADRQIADGDVVDVSAPGRETFYSAPPANYGAGAAGAARGTRA